MKKDNLEKSIKSLEQIRMTGAERERMLKNIINDQDKPVPSPFFPRLVPSAWPLPTKVPIYAALLFLLVFAGGSGITAAAQKSLPGDRLYPVKVKVIEPVKSALIFNAEKKEDYKIKLAEERIKEAETLIVRVADNPEKQRRVDEFLSNNAKDLDKSIEKVRSKKREEKHEAKKETGEKFEENKKGEELRAYLKLLESRQVPRAEDKYEENKSKKENDLLFPGDTSLDKRGEKRVRIERPG